MREQCLLIHRMPPQAHPSRAGCGNVPAIGHMPNSLVGTLFWAPDQYAACAAYMASHAACYADTWTVSCRYLLRVTIARAYGGSMVQDVQLWVRNYEEPIEEVTPPIKVRLGGPLIKLRLACISIQVLAATTVLDAIECAHHRQSMRRPTELQTLCLLCMRVLPDCVQVPGYLCRSAS